MPAEVELCGKEWLKENLQANKHLIILDCRSSTEYAASHIIKSLNISIPSILLRRLAAGKIDLFSTIKCRDLKNRILDNYSDNIFVLYHNTIDDSIINILYRKLMAELSNNGCRVLVLEDGFPEFQSTFPEWCEDERSNSLQTNSTDQLMGLRSLRISTPLSDSACSSSTESSDGESSSNYPIEPYGGEPVEILPGLFLGNAAHSEDINALQKYNIRYILNVTPDLPNVFQDTGKIEYLQIPITDHWSQDLSVHFPSCIKFIDEAKSKDVSVLVHCLAGVSRSVTITLAYLMYSRGLSLNEAFTFVRARKPDISPNFHFMEQLHTFERQLKNDPTRCCTASMSQPSSASTSNLTPSSSSSYHRSRHIKYSCICNELDCKCAQQTSEFLLGPMTHQSPDSGIEFDRWTPSDNTPK